MSDISDAATWSYRTGPWFAVFGPEVTLLLPAAQRDQVIGLWSLIDGGAGFDEVLDGLLATGLSKLPGFVLVSTTSGPTRVLVRGEGVSAGLTAADGEVALSGSGAGTWSEQTVEGITALTVTVPDDPAGEGEPTGPEADYVIPAGLVRVGRIDRPARVGPAVEPAAAAGAVPAEPAPAAESAAPDAAPVAAVAPAVVARSTDEAEPEPEAGADEGAVAEEEPAEPAPVAADGEEAPAEADPLEQPPGEDTRYSWMTPWGTLPDEDAEAAEAADPAAGEVPSPAPEEQAPEAPAAGAHAAQAPPVPAPPAEPPPAEPPAGFAPPVGEPTGQPPAAPGFASTDTDTDHDGLTAIGDDPGPQRPEQGIPGQPPAPEVTPPVAKLVISDGQSVMVDRVVLIGRAPEARRFTSTEQPTLVTVPSRLHEISSTHVEVRPGTGADHGTAVVTDMGSTNGTVLQQPGLGDEDLKPGIAVQLIPGAVINLGDGITIQVTRP